MTHEELLAKIENQESLNSQSLGNGSIGNALRAVVELHKPEMMISSSYCVECTINLETIIYPCPTIQAIEKELS
jgi:hypothetical protein